MTYAELADDVDISVGTAWRYVQLMTGFLAEVLCCSREDAEVALAGKVCLVDGTLIPTFNWRHRSDLYSGKHKRHGVNVQALTDIHGRIVWTSAAFPGSHHDAWCFDHAALTKMIGSSGECLGDSGYQGCDVTSPLKKKPGLERSEHDKAFNTSLAKVRVGVEWGFGHLKNWRILASRYRGSLSRIDLVIQAVSGLQKINERLSDRDLAFRSSLY
jgi:hypothetical protein